MDVRRETEQNAQAAKRREHSLHHRRLREAVSGICRGVESPLRLRDVAAAACKAGLPVRPDSLFAPADVLAAEARFICLAFPSLSSLHKDARGWLEARFKKPSESFGAAIPWNLACSGEVVE